MNMEEFMNQIYDLNLDVRASDLNKTIFGIYTYRIFSDKMEKIFDEIIEEWEYTIEDENENEYIPKYNELNSIWDDGYFLEEHLLYVIDHEEFFIDSYLLFSNIVKDTINGMDAADLLTDAFKEYKHNWLMLYDDYPDQSEEKKEEILKKHDIFREINLDLYEPEELKNIILLIHQIEIDISNEKEITNSFNELSIEFTKKFKEFNENITNPYINNIIEKIILHDKPIELLRMYDPVMGIGSTLTEIYSTRKMLREKSEKNGKYSSIYMGCTIFGIEKNRTTFSQAKMNLTANVYRESFEIKNENTLLSNKDYGKFNVIIGDLPFESKKNTEYIDISSDPRFKEYNFTNKHEFLFIEDMIYKMSDDAILVAVIPPSFLFTEVSGTSIRKKILQKNIVDTIIKLPKNNAFSSINQFIIIMKNYDRNEGYGKEKPILFIDASKNYEKEGNNIILSEKEIEKIIKTYANREEIENYSRNVSLHEISKNNYTLNMNTYLNYYKIEEIEIKEPISKIKDIEKQIYKNSIKLREIFEKNDIEPPF